MSALGLDSSSLKRRSALLEDLRSRLAEPLPPARPRVVLKAPQKLLLEAGEVVIYPICKGKPINPYAVGKEWAWVKAWRQDGWGALVVAERGLVFGFLAWYRPLLITYPFSSEPALAELTAPRTWSLGSPGTLTTCHYGNMQMRSVGHISIDGGPNGKPSSKPRISVALRGQRHIALQHHSSGSHKRSRGAPRQARLPAQLADRGARRNRAGSVNEGPRDRVIFQHFRHRLSARSGRMRATARRNSRLVCVCPVTERSHRIRLEDSTMALKPSIITYDGLPVSSGGGVGDRVLAQHRKGGSLRR
jgi:hypothetical protein